MKKILSIVLVLALIIGCVILNFYISFGYGDFQGFVAELQPAPKEEKLEELRLAANSQLAQAQEELSSLTGLTLYEKTYSDMCAKGTHGWKRTDSYAYVCSYRLTTYYGTNRNYSELLLDLEKTLPDLGWSIGNQTPKQPGISESIREYSGEIYLVELPYYQKKGSDGHTITLTINGFYGDGAYWNSPGKEPDPFGFGIALYQEIYKDASNISPEEISKKITASGQVPIMIATSKEYFRN